MTRTALILKKQGQIKSMELPDGWVEIPVEPHTGSDFLKEYRSPDSEEVKISFYYRGARISQGGAEDFLAVLALPDHELSEDEFLSVDLVVRNASDPEYFLLSSSRTETLNGKRVLFVEGIWNTGIVYLAMFIDSDNTGSAVQEVHYQAPEKDFEHSLQLVEKSFKTIVWL